MLNNFSKRSCAFIVVGLIAGFATAVRAYDQSVIMSCTGDYLSYCSQYDPDSDKTRDCMEEHRDDLSKACVKALVDAGEVPKKYFADKSEKE